MLTISYEVGVRSHGTSTEKQADHNSQYGASHHNRDGRDKPPPFRPKCSDETHGQMLHRSPSNCCKQAISLIDILRHKGRLPVLNPGEDEGDQQQLGQHDQGNIAAANLVHLSKSWDTN